MNQDEFDAALAAKVASFEETTADAPSEDSDVVELYPEDSVADEPQEDDAPSKDVETLVEELESEERLRDDQGRFLPKFNDPDVQAYLERFGGDLSQALRSAVEAQSLIGRQGSELGELRKAVEELSHQFQQSAEIERQQPTVYQGDLEEALEEAPHEVVQYAIQAGDGRLYEQALRSWYEVDPFSATQFDWGVKMEGVRAEMREQLEPATAPIREQKAARELQAADKALAERYADFHAVMQSATESDFEGFPDTLARQVQDGSAAEKQAALEAMYRWVKASRVVADQVARDQRAADKKAEKKDAFVASATSTPTAREETGVDKLKKYMLEPEPYSVRHGLS